MYLTAAKQVSFLRIRREAACPALPTGGRVTPWEKSRFGDRMVGLEGGSGGLRAIQVY